MDKKFEKWLKKNFDVLSIQYIEEDLFSFTGWCKDLYKKKEIFQVLGEK